MPHINLTPAVTHQDPTASERARAPLTRRPGQRHTPPSIAGQKFGRLRVLRFHGRNLTGSEQWQVLCACGTRKVLDRQTLTRRQHPTRSCGCLTREQITALNTRHGQARTPEYRTWTSMNARCAPGSDRYPQYGGRGVRVCDAWKNDFAAFFQDLGPRPDGEHSLDRIDVDGDYAPGNCRWATRITQANNQRRTRRVFYQSVQNGLTELARAHGLVRSTLLHRLERGYSVEDALRLPMLEKPGERHLIFGGVVHTIRSLAEHSGVSRQTLRDRLKRGQSPEQAASQTPQRKA